MEEIELVKNDKHADELVSVRLEDFRTMKFCMEFCADALAFINRFPYVSQRIVNDVIPRIDKLYIDVEAEIANKAKKK